MVVRDPEPAVSQHGLVRRADATSIHNGAETILAAINARILSRALFDPLDKTRRLIDPHGAARIMPVLFEIEHKQNAARLDGGAAPVHRDDIQKMFGLADRISGVAEMVSAPEQTRARSRRLAGAVIRVAIEARISRFVNHADKALALHGFELDAHQVVVRKIHYAVPNEPRRDRHEKDKKNVHGEKIHRADD